MFLCQRSLYLYYKFVPGSEVYIVRIFFDPRAMVQFCLFLDQIQTCPPSLVPLFFIFSVEIEPDFFSIQQTDFIARKCQSIVHFNVPRGFKYCRNLVFRDYV